MITFLLIYITGVIASVIVLSLGAYFKGKEDITLEHVFLWFHLSSWFGAGLFVVFIIDEYHLVDWGERVGRKWRKFVRTVIIKQKKQ